MIKILIADDHELVRRGIKEILQEGISSIHVEEAADTGTLIEKALDDNWDLIISDLSMPGGGGIIALEKILEKKPGEKILILTIYPEEQYALRVMKNGASGFLNKDIAPDELLKAVQVILRGDLYLQPYQADNFL